MTRLRATGSPAELDPASRTRELGPGAGRRARDVTALLVAAVGVFADAQTPPPSLFPSLPECRADRARQSAGARTCVRLDLGLAR